jgi:hypothetical protein
MFSALLTLWLALPAPAPQSDGLTKTTITIDQTIEDVPCGPGVVWRFQNTGRLHRCTLGHDAVVRGAALPGGSVVAFTAEGLHQFVFLSRAATIDGVSCRGGGDGFMTTLHPSGKLKLCWLVDNTTIQGVPCASFTVWSDVVKRDNSGVIFHENGQLAECRLFEAVKLDGQSFQKNDRIRLDVTGHALPPGDGNER